MRYIIIVLGFTTVNLLSGCCSCPKQLAMLDTKAESFQPDGIELVYVNGKGEIKDFYIGKFEVTQAQWKAITGKNPIRFKGDNRPVEMISWDDIQIFLSDLNFKTGREYRLPTEAEWEYAARGGINSRNYKYSGSHNLREVGWFIGNNRFRRPQPVGTKSPNELEIYDMSGNVWEWCADQFGKYRIIRGGASNSPEHICLPISRIDRYGSTARRDVIGFRLALNP